MIKTTMKQNIMKKLFLSIILLISFTTWAELPSWGMTENQYKLPTFNNKMNEIGKQAFKNNWLLKVTAPEGWHNNIRNALTQIGERDVQLTLKDSLYQSIAISAFPGAKIAKINPSSSSDSIVQKQVVIEKPEINTAIEAPDFGESDFKNNTNELLTDMDTLDIVVPTHEVKPTKTKRKIERKKNVVKKPTTVEQPEVVTESVVSKSQSKPSIVADNKDSIKDIKEVLRKRHARNKIVDKQLSYRNIKTKDELFIQESVVLIKRFLNQGIVMYFWMSEPYDPTVHKMVEKGVGKFKKDPAAIEVQTKKIVAEKDDSVPMKFGFIAVDNMVEDKEYLRKSKIRNKRVEYTISAEKLKKDDILYVKNQTVLVERPLAPSQSYYYWLVGETNFNKEVKQKRGSDRFVIQ